jgi:signal transduction histidine kinase
VRRLLFPALVPALLAALLAGLIPLAEPWFTGRFLPARLEAQGASHLERLEAAHRAAREALRVLDREALPSWGALEAARLRLEDGAFLLASSPEGHPLAWAGDPRDLAFIEGVRVAFTPGGCFLVHSIAAAWGRLVVAQPLPAPSTGAFVRSAVLLPANAFPSLPAPRGAAVRTFLFKPGGGAPVLALQLEGVQAAEAARVLRRLLGAAVSMAWALLLLARARAVPPWSLPILIRLALLIFPIQLLPLPPAWISPTAFCLPHSGPAAGTPLEAALTLLAAALALARGFRGPVRGWLSYAGGFAAVSVAFFALAAMAVRASALGPLPFPLRTALPSAAWILGGLALRIRPLVRPPRALPWMAAALVFLLAGPPLPGLVVVLAAGSFGLVCWRLEAFAPTALAALWGLALPHALASAEWQAYLDGPHAALRLQRPSLEALELGRSVPGLLAGWDWLEQGRDFPLMEDTGSLAERLAHRAGLDRGTVDYSMTLIRDGAAISVSRSALLRAPARGDAPAGAFRMDAREPDLLSGVFPLWEGGRPWGEAVVQFRPRPPSSPEGETMPVLIGLYDRAGNPLEPGSVFLPPHLGSADPEDLPGWTAVHDEGDRRALFYLPAWEFPFPYLPFALLLLVGVILSLPRPFDPRGLLALAMLPLMALLALAALLAFTFTLRQERDLRALQEQWSAGAQKDLLDESAGVLPDLQYRGGILDGGAELSSSLRYAPAALMASPPFRPRTVEFRGRPYLFFIDTEGRLCALQRPNLPALEKPVAWLARRTWGIFLASLAGALMVLLGLLKRFTEPIARLAESARAIQRGAPFDPGALSASREINDLAEALRDAIGRLRHEERTLREILARLPVGVALVGGGATLFRNAPLEAAGLAVEELETLPDHATFSRGGRVFLARRVPLPGGRLLLLASDITAEVTAQKMTTFAEVARIVAHEVKNPLTPIRLSIDYLKELAARDPARYRAESPAVLEEIAQSVDDLEHAAMEFSDFARLPALQREDRDLAELLAGWLAPYASSADVRFEPPDGAVRAAVDPRLLKRALFNLLANAWQSASPPPPVTVRLNAADGAAWIRVSDAGPGVPPELLERLFEPYFTTKASGTGLGLLIARRIVEEHGGSIEARNRPEGGLTVEIRLPMSGSSAFGVRRSE